MKSKKLDKNRYFVNLLLKRAKRFHASITGVARFDCENLIKIIRSAQRRGEKVSINAFLIRATAELLRRHPELNQHMFTSLSGKQNLVSFDNISCTTVIHRRLENGEYILLPLKISNVDQLSVAQIAELMRYHKKTPLDELEQYNALNKLNNLPRFILRYFSYKTRSDASFYTKYYGSYGFSTLNYQQTNLVSIQTMANTAVSFVPFGINTQTNDNNQARKYLQMNIVYDHYIVDGILMDNAVRTLAKLIDEPEFLLGS